MKPRVDPSELLNEGEPLALEACVLRSFSCSLRLELELSGARTVVGSLVFVAPEVRGDIYRKSGSFGTRFGMRPGSRA